MAGVQFAEVLGLSQMWLDFTDLVTRPTAALRAVEDQRRLSAGLWAFAVALGLPALVGEVGALGPYHDGALVGAAGSGSDLQPLMQVFSHWLYQQRFLLPLLDLVAATIFWAVAVVLIHLSSRALSGQGGLGGLVTLTGYVALLGLLSLPVTLLTAVLQAAGRGPAAGSLAPLALVLGVAIFLWQNAMLVQAARVHYRLSLNRAITAVIGPLAAVAVLLVALTVFLAVAALTLRPIGP